MSDLNPVSYEVTALDDGGIDIEVSCDQYGDRPFHKSHSVVLSSMHIMAEKELEVFLTWAQVLAETPLPSETEGVADDPEREAILKAVRFLVQEVA